MARRATLSSDLKSSLDGLEVLLTLLTLSFSRRCSAFVPGRVIWMSQCCYGPMSVLNKLFVDNMIIFYLFVNVFCMSFQANGSQYIYCAVSEVEEYRRACN